MQLLNGIYCVLMTRIVKKFHFEKDPNTIKFLLCWLIINSPNCLIAIKAGNIMYKCYMHVENDHMTYSRPTGLCNRVLSKMKHV